MGMARMAGVVHLASLAGLLWLLGTESAYAAEEIKVTTYYTGQSSKFTKVAVGKPDATGKSPYWDALAAAPEGTLLAEGPVGIGTTTPGTTRLAVMGGSVGIGTTAPSARLHVTGGEVLFENPVDIGTATPGTIPEVLLHVRKDSSTVGPRVVVENASVSGGSGGGGPAASFEARNAATAEDGTMLGTTGVNYTSTGGFIQDGGVLSAGAGLSGGLSLMARHSAGAIRFYTGGDTERLRITAAGNVGIGTASPGSTLDVAGALTLRGVEAPPVSPVGQGRLYFSASQNQFLASENSGPYRPLGRVRMQSGIVFVPRDTLISVTFPTPFPSGVTPIVLLTPDTTASGSTVPVTFVRKRSNKRFVCFSQQDANVQWVAIDPNSMSM